MNATVRRGMAQAAMKRAALGVAFGAVGALMLLLACVPVVKGTKIAPDFPPIIRVLLWVMMLGIGIVFPIAGIRFVLKAIMSFHFKPARMPGQAMIRFMKELLGGPIIPGNQAVAFLYLSDDCQRKWGEWTSLKRAVRLFAQSLKQEHNDTSLCFEINQTEICIRATAGGASGSITFDAVFPGGPGDKPKSFPHTVEFSLAEVNGHWYITDFNGGFSQFIGDQHIAH